VCLRTSVHRQVPFVECSDKLLFVFRKTAVKLSKSPLNLDPSSSLQCMSVISSANVRLHKKLQNVSK